MNIEQIIRLLRGETGLKFEASVGGVAETLSEIKLTPSGQNARYTFAIRIELKWRRLRIEFEPGRFASGLLSEMSNANKDGQAAFLTILKKCEQMGARVFLSINGAQSGFEDAAIWRQDWRRIEFYIEKGGVEVGAVDGEPDVLIVNTWLLPFVAAVLALVPVEDSGSSEMSGFPEGALKTITVNRYERDPRNRSAAIALHGTRCAACGVELGEIYGEVGTGCIEIHHVVPVSKMGPDYVVDPKVDLVPLCPNCHTIAHKRTPPYSVDEISSIIESVNSRI